MSVISNQILAVAKQLMPRGRAFRVPEQGKGTGFIYTDMYGDPLTDMYGNFIVSPDWTRGNGGFLERLLKAFGGDGGNRVGTLERCYNDATSILYHILPYPTNDKFTDGTINPVDNDCNDWEGNVGLLQWGITGALTPTRLQRMAAISTKMAYPGSDAPRQSAGYLQSMLQASGFPLYVYENLSGLTPAEVLGMPEGNANLGNFDLGQLNLGSSYSEGDISVIANSLNPLVDAGFVVNDYHGTFFIAGSTITTFANIPAIQQTQLRQLILNLKPAHLAGFLFINYI